MESRPLGFGRSHDLACSAFTWIFCLPKTSTQLLLQALHTSEDHSAKSSHLTTYHIINPDISPLLEAADAEEYLTTFHSPPRLSPVRHQLRMDPRRVCRSVDSSSKGWLQSGWSLTGGQFSAGSYMLLAYQWPWPWSNQATQFDRLSACLLLRPTTLGELVPVRDPVQNRS